MCDNMPSKTKKGRNPPAVDNWLDSLGLYRKNVAYDETCLFRAVSEQLFECQIYHEKVRKECIDYGRSYPNEFWYMLEDEDQWYDHLDLLEKHMVVCGNIEIQIISLKYDHNVIIYDALHQEVHQVTNRDSGKFLTLCLMNEDHYDVVHQKLHIQNAGFCQSLAYTMLYEDVFQVPKVQDIVRGMLYGKEYISLSSSQVNNNADVQVKAEKQKVKGNDEEAPNVAPFPFKIAKALDPTIYRNIEYDAWTEIRRELRLGEWYYGDDNLILGTRCIYNDKDQTFECYIQEIIKDQNKCIVYVTKLAQKLTVNYTDLSPENDAKPWPLPYRFTKNLVVTPNQSSKNNEKASKLPKKRKDKGRPKSETQTVTTTEATDQDIEAFIGAPLIRNNPDNSFKKGMKQKKRTKQQIQNSSSQKRVQETPLETRRSQHNLLVTPEISSPMPKFTWETPWNNIPGSADKFVWSQAFGASPIVYNNNTKPVVTSAPVTPNIVSYQDSQFPFVYNYPADNYPNYSSWNNTSTDYDQNSPYSEPEEVTEKNESYHSPQSQFSDSYETQSPPEVPHLTMPPPNSQPMEVFSHVIPIPPGTPVIYAHSAEIPEMVMPTAPFQVYTPPVDVQYVSPAPYFYSPTIPTTTWYPLGINSQGFIFPTPANQNFQNN